jgi:hypothetical protein
LKVKVNANCLSGFPCKQGCGPNYEVVSAFKGGLGTAKRDAARRGGYAKRVAKVDAAKDAVQKMVAIIAHAGDAKGQIQLGMGLFDQGHPSDPIVTEVAGREQGRRWRLKAQKAGILIPNHMR